MGPTQDPSAKYAVGGASATLKSAPSTSSRGGPSAKNGKKAKLPVRQLVHLLWRLVTFGSAVFYVVASLRSGISAIQVLRGAIHSGMEFVPYDAFLIQHFLGRTTVAQSPLLTTYLNGSTTPRTDTMYLETRDRVSFTGCTGVATFNPWLYGNVYLHELWDDLGANTGYNLTFLESHELVVAVVDCSFGSITSGDDTVARVFYVVRAKSPAGNNNGSADVAIVTLSLSIQDYMLLDEHRNGAAGIAAITFVTDVSETARVDYHYAVKLSYPYEEVRFKPYRMLGTSDHGFWMLEGVPRNGSGDIAKVIKTASRTGFYINAESEQSNIKNLHWRQPPVDPLIGMTKWDWAGRSVIRDSWAWLHGVHFIFAADSLFNLVLLLVVVYRNLQKGKFWVGDAFMSVTSTIELRGLLILVTWYVNGFWRLMEFCLVEANVLGNVQRIYTNAFIIRADLMTIYMCMAGLLGKIVGERVDPAVVVLVFQLGFSYRQSIAAWLPATKRVSAEFANYDYMKGMVEIPGKYTTMSPMRLWTAHPMVERDASFICATLFPAFASFVVVIVLVFVRKTYFRAFPKAKVVWSKVTGQSAAESGESNLAFKSSLTMFEVATGAPLQHRVGLASDYDNCIYIKGMKFASPDGIYCNGYVIVNGAYLVATADMPAIIVIVLFRLRFKNVYAYEVHGHKVQQTSRLVYPHTMAPKDLVQLNIGILS